MRHIILTVFVSINSYPLLNAVKFSNREVNEVLYWQSNLLLIPQYINETSITLSKPHAVSIIETFLSFPKELQLYLLRKIQIRKKPDLIEALSYSTTTHTSTILHEWFQSHSEIKLKPEIIEIIGRSFQIEIQAGDQQEREYREYVTPDMNFIRDEQLGYKEPSNES